MNTIESIRKAAEEQGIFLLEPAEKLIQAYLDFHNLSVEQVDLDDTCLKLGIYSTE